MGPLICGHCLLTAENRRRTDSGLGCGPGLIKREAITTFSSMSNKRKLRTQKGGYGKPAPTRVSSTPKRPTWQRNLGIFSLVMGVGILVLNFAVRLGLDIGLLPGGHNPLYFLIGLIAAGNGAWLIGALDRP